MTSDLAQKECRPCEGVVTPLRGQALKEMERELSGNWRVVESKRLEKQFKFPDFRHALEFTKKVGELAEGEGHHPDIYLTYGEVRIELSTHKIGGLSENDFILAAKINEVL